MCQLVVQVVTLSRVAGRWEILQQMWTPLERLSYLSQNEGGRGARRNRSRTLIYMGKMEWDKDDQAGVWAIRIIDTQWHVALFLN